MDSRESILQAVLHNQPESSALPDISMFTVEFEDTVQQYMDLFKSIDGKAVAVKDLAEVKAYIHENFDMDKRTITTLPELSDIAGICSADAEPHSFDDVELAIISSRLAVAENGAVWLTDDVMGQRIVPYICQHLAVILDANSIVNSMHDAYAIIGTGDYGFGGFIGGPSKTADIEQALVLGAHGPLSMTVFIIKS